MLTAISSGVSARIGSPIGACTRAANISPVTPDAASRSRAMAIFRRAANAAEVGGPLAEQLLQNPEIRLMVAGHDDGIVPLAKREPRRRLHRICQNRSRAQSNAAPKSSSSRASITVTSKPTRATSGASFCATWPAPKR